MSQSQTSPQSKTELLSKESSERDRAIFQCRIAESVERFDDMAKFVKTACEKGCAEGGDNKIPMSVNDRNFMSVAYKNCVGSRRMALRGLEALKTRYEQKREGAEENVKVIDEYYQTLFAELKRYCNEVLELIDKTIMSQAIIDKLPKNQHATEFKVFFYKMKGDYYRYLSEFTVSDEYKEAVENASAAYEAAKKEAEGEGQEKTGKEEVGLVPSNPVRLGLFLNYSVFKYEILGQKKEAKAMAEEAFNEGLGSIDQAPNNSADYRDSTAILQLLRDNNTLWSHQDGDAAAAGNPVNPDAPQ